MTREKAKELLPIIQAFVEGKTIQVWANDTWQDEESPLFWAYAQFRIKPEQKSEPKYRPFKTKEECWNEMLKHQPFGWLKEKTNKKEIAHIGRIFDVPNDTLITLSMDEGRNLSSSYFFRTYTFVDGTPFGIKEGNSYDSKA